ncbi:MAG: hypothetical protein AB4040_07775 [Synechococcus sp.]
MARLILHVGPGKCGSSSIQKFFATQKKPCIQNTHFLLLNPLEISKLNCEEPSESIFTNFTELLLDNLIGCDVLILSHEYLFQCPYAVKNICSLAKKLVKEISIIGYSRRQSDFLISAYFQWLFRSPDRIKETTYILDKLELDPVLFSGLERQLIASIANDFYSARQLSEYSILEWYSSYKKISQLVHESGAVTKCGVLPYKEPNISLIQDFCKKSDLTLRDEMKKVSQQVSNLSFNQDIIEAINNAVAFGLDVPGPHDSNAVLHLLSTKMVKSEKKSSDFLANLKSYIDTYYLTSNYNLCREYGLSKAYFTPSVQFSKLEILDKIIFEGQQRALNKSAVISDYRILSARMIELCLRLAKGN